MRVAENLVTYFFGALIVAIVLKNGPQVSSIISSISMGANSVSSALLSK